ncbi:SDR family NAD(P)-dependent oxidoreductase [Shinella sp.]|uniref:SDR family NAD(P)-dependent oxidoreductase n=1 Tax=Shinella sp. TaxID=1870904 RepID=UPI003F6E9438
MTSEQKSLSGRVAIVTGSGRNIGRAIAHALAGEGANIVLNGHRDKAALDAVAEELRALGVEVMVRLVDVGDAQAVAQMVDDVVGQFGRVDIAVSNVSVRLRQAFLDISLDDWKRVLDTNLNAAFYMARAVLPHMKQQGWGRIVHISGNDGFRPIPFRAHNVTCKAATFALSKAIALEFGEFGVTANTVAPGLTETVRDEAHYPNFRVEHEKRRQQIPVRRMGKPEDIAESVRFLCSDRAGYITGQIMHVNGGEHMF